MRSRRAPRVITSWVQESFIQDMKQTVLVVSERK